MHKKIHSFFKIVDGFEINNELYLIKLIKLKKRVIKKMFKVELQNISD